MDLIVRLNLPPTTLNKPSSDMPSSVKAKIHNSKGNAIFLLVIFKCSMRSHPNIGFISLSPRKKRTNKQDNIN